MLWDNTVTPCWDVCFYNPWVLLKELLSLPQSSYGHTQEIDSKSGNVSTCLSPGRAPHELGVLEATVAITYK